MKETSLEKKFKSYVEKQKGLCLKWVSPGFTGVPDRVVLMPGRKVFFVEMKRPGGKQSPRQKRVAAQLAKLGHEVLVIDDESDFTKILS